MGFIQSSSQIPCYLGHPRLQVKGGGAVPPKGTSHSLTVTSKEDFRRDVLKSDTAVLELPQIELVMEMGTLGSMYTTVEGLLSKVPLRCCHRQLR